MRIYLKVSHLNYPLPKKKNLPTIFRYKKYFWSFNIILVLVLKF